MKRLSGAGTELIETSAPTAFGPFNPARSLSSLSASTRFCEHDPCSSWIRNRHDQCVSKKPIVPLQREAKSLTQFSTPSPLYRAGSHAAISVSWIPLDESSIKVRIGSLKFDTNVSLTLGRRCSVAARVCVMLIYSIGTTLAACCELQA